MEDKRADSGAHPPATSDAPAAEPTSIRRRGVGHKRKASSLSGGSNSSSAPSKRLTREKASLSHSQIHNGPLTRARQGPSSSLASALSAAAASTPPAKRPEVTSLEAEQAKRESEIEALEASMDAEFEAIRSRDANAHVVPNHCGWFSWTTVHPIEERMLPSFFNGKSDTRTPETYLEIRNCIMKKFHADPGTLIELKDMLELEVGDFDSRQEVMEFLDHWGLINFHPFPTSSNVASVNNDAINDVNNDVNNDAINDVNNDGEAENESLVDKLYHFEALESRSSVVPKTNIITPTLPSGLFPEPAIAEELVRPEGPAVEYHCNSCSADCSRKRYHCQKQADYDLCSDCFNNGKLDAGMSSSDFILMEPAEAPGVSGGNWTDQETLLLLEALELFKDQWSEIAEHVATKTKAQCILHFVQMPIEDTFLDYDDDLDATAKGTAVPASTSNDLLAPKDPPEATEMTGANESDNLTSKVETSKEKASEMKAKEDASKPEEENEVKVGQEPSKSEDTGELNVEQETDENLALKALQEAFEVVGYPPTPEGQLSFSEVGNPVMTLAAFLARLAGPDHALASAHNSLKSISAESPGIELASRHCFILEDPPNDGKEQAGPESVTAESEVQNDKNGEENSQKVDNSTSGLEDKGLSNDNSDKKLEEVYLEEKLKSPKEQDDIVPHEEVGTDNLNQSNQPELPKDPPLTLGESDDLMLDAPPSSVKELGEDMPDSVPSTSVEKPSEASETPMDVDISDSNPSTKSELQHPVASNSLEEPSPSTEASKEADASNGVASEIYEQQQLVAPEVEEPPQPAEASKDIDMACDSQPPPEKELPQPIENIASEDQTEDSKNEKHDCTDTKNDKQGRKGDQKFDKVKHAAISAVSAAAVKAKLLAEQEEDQIRQLAAMLIEKQLHKLEAKLGFFNEMESVVMRVKEQLDRSRQKLYHERAQIIAARLGMPGSSARGMPPGMATNRMGMNMANLVPRPPHMMTSQRPPMSRPIGGMAPTPLNQFSSTALAGNSVRPPSQDTISSVNTK